MAYLPFGGGPRQCPFKSYGMFEAVLVLATIAQRYKIELAPGERAVPHDTVNGLLPGNGLVVIARRGVERNSSGFRIPSTAASR